MCVCVHVCVCVRVCVWHVCVSILGISAMLIYVYRASIFMTREGASLAWKLALLASNYDSNNNSLHYEAHSWLVLIIIFSTTSLLI